MNVPLLNFDGCPSWQTAGERLRVLADELGFTIDRRTVNAAAEAENLRFRGSPTILVDGRDPFARGDEPVGLSCRIYQAPDGPSGVPPSDSCATRSPDIHSQRLRLEQAEYPRQRHSRRPVED